ncbi:hypothetical protein AIOL_001504 [Candidatus Rhodobacter oscarellae]|uniref:Uncharacterized protein n=2 Tax=Candidatus Rhodobacter oscarellae TaxID=1675527 RepID=A0A0J9E1D6_9RHOB|nr:hypothetical protein AIOL_001504 [Candidatus Rhodobacter lobularis]
MNSASGKGVIAVRETNFGYIIKSEPGADGSVLQDRNCLVALAALGIAIVAVWWAPGAYMPVAINVALTLVLLVAAGLALVTLRRSGAGSELHVDTNRREMRSAARTPSGEIWIRTSARFTDVSELFLSSPRPQSDLRALSLRIVGEEEVVPVAVGDEATLLTLHDRLMQDLRPLEERIAGHRFHATRPESAAQRVFPVLGPEKA